MGLREHAAAGDLHGDRAEEKDGGVEPEDGGDAGGEPVVDVAVGGVEVAAGLGDEEDADQGGEEHEVAGEGEEDAEAVACRAFRGGRDVRRGGYSSCRRHLRRRCACRPLSLGGRRPEPWSWSSGRRFLTRSESMGVMVAAMGGLSEGTR